MNKNYKIKIEKAKAAIQNAEYILIGGGAGLSSAGGLAYSGKRFEDNFPDFIVRYGIEDMYSAGFYPFNSQEEKWAYWSKHIKLNRYDTGFCKIYIELKKIIECKKYFVITTNVDAQFYKTGFDAKNIFAVQGDYGKNQCAKGCHRKLYDNEELVKAMVEQQFNCRIPKSLVPKCPMCGSNMEVNIRKDSYFIQDDNWDKSKYLFASFIQEAQGHKLVLLEIGVGFNTPTIIRIPFEQITFNEPNAALIRVNKDLHDSIPENSEKTISFSESAEQVIEDLLYYDSN
jgi:NAD-dependent SIR2 family protein deacetylase